MKISKKTIIFIGIAAVIGFIFNFGVFILKNTHAPIITPHAGPYEGVGCYIINLDKSKDRYAVMRPRVEQLGFHTYRVPAIYGRDIPQSKLKKIMDHDVWNTYSKEDPGPGAIGCYLSHVKAWTQFLTSNHQYAIIFEDDVGFTPHHFRGIIHQLLLKTKYWDIVTLNPEKDGLPIKITPVTEKEHLVLYLSRVFCTGAYLIHRDAAQKLLNKSYPLKMPIDHYFTRGWELDLKFTSVEPRPAYQSFGDSEVAFAKHDRQVSQEQTFWERVKMKIYRITSEIYRFIFNMYLYLKLKMV